MSNIKDQVLNNVEQIVPDPDEQAAMDPKLAMGAVCSVSIFMIGIPIMYYTADLTTISRSILEAATIDGAGMKDQ